MAVCGCMLVRDEADLIRDTIEFHLAHGIDYFLIIDNGSIDGTGEICRSFRNTTVLTRTELDWPQATWRRLLTQLARERGATWCVQLDADERWCGLDCLAAYAAPVVETTKLYEYPPVDLGNMIYYLTTPGQSLYHWSSSRPTTIRSAGYRRMVYRPLPGIEPAAGRIVWEHQPVLTDRFSVHHYPIRNYHQFERRVRLHGEAYLRAGGDPTIGYHRRGWYNDLLEDRLQQVYADKVLTQSNLAMLKAFVDCNPGSPHPQCR